MALLAICVMPLALRWLGVDLATAKPGDFTGVAHVDRLYYLLRGSFAHTLYEWTGVCAATFVAALALVQYRMTKNPSLPVIGTAMFCAGAMDAFHTLAADRLIEVVADNRDLVPFTWALCRLFTGTILLVGVGIFAFSNCTNHRPRPLLVLTICGLFVAVSYMAVRTCALSENLPQTMFPDALIKRPYDIYPLIPFLVCGLFVLPAYLRRNNTVFGCSVLISMIPQVAAQLYMAFGSFQLHDQWFNVAHGLKVVAYIVPIAGLFLEFVQTYERQRRLVVLNREQSEELRRHSQDLEVAQLSLLRVAEFASNLNQVDAVDTYAEALKAVLDASQAPVGVLWTVAESGELTQRVAVGPDQIVASSGQLDAGGLPAQAAATGEAIVLVGPFREVASLRAGPVAISPHSVRAWPVQFHSRCVGVLVVVHLREPTQDEVGYTKTIIDQLGSRLESVETERQRQDLTVELQRTNAELEARVEDLDQFTYLASHDLQEPLRKMKSFSKLLREDIGDNLTDDVEADLGYIVDASTRMQRLVQDLLYLSRTSNCELLRTHVSMDECVDEAMQVLAERIRETGTEVQRDVLPVVEGDAILITQLFQNLIGNAIKYCKPGIAPRIWITAVDVGGHYTFGVRDNGVGIDPKYAQKIFMPFQRLQAASNQDGSGIGLAVCQKAVARHCGRIYVEPALGGGSHFQFTLEPQASDAGLVANSGALGRPLPATSDV